MMERFTYRKTDNAGLANESCDPRQPCLSLLPLCARRPAPSRLTLGAVVTWDALTTSITWNNNSA